MITTNYQEKISVRSAGSVKPDGTVAQLTSDVRSAGLTATEIKEQQRYAALQNLRAQVPSTQSHGAAALVPSNPLPVKSFGDYSEQERQSMRDNAQALTKGGELFYQTNPGESLVQARAYDVLSALEYGQGRVFQVNAGATHSAGRSTDSHQVTGWQQNWGSGPRDHSFVTVGERSTAGSTSVTTSASPIPSWEAFNGFVKPTGKGLPDISTLPAPSATLQLKAWDNSTTFSGFSYQVGASNTGSPKVGNGWTETTYWEG
jgi:hypothetical protein